MSAVRFHGDRMRVELRAASGSLLTASLPAEAPRPSVDALVRVQLPSAELPVYPAAR